MNTIYTSSGIIRNAELPRIGIVSANSLESFVFDEIDQGIDLDYEMLRLDLDKQGYSEEKIDSMLEDYENDNATIIFGGWIKIDGRYSPDKTKEFAAEYCRIDNIITVVWSETTKRCHHTSPCYVMADGSGPCADLDSVGDAVIGYDLPSEYYANESEGVK